jgi:hypothetical protein
MHRSLPSVTRVPVVYCRVSSTAQRPDLKRRVLEEFCAARGIAMSRLSSWRRPQSQRPKFMALMACEGWRSFVPSFFPILAKFTFGKVVRVFQRSAEKRPNQRAGTWHLYRHRAYRQVLRMNREPQRGALCARLGKQVCESFLSMIKLERSASTRNSFELADIRFPADSGAATACSNVAPDSSARRFHGVTTTLPFMCGCRPQKYS